MLGAQKPCMADDKNVTNPMDETQMLRDVTTPQLRQTKGKSTKAPGTRHAVGAGIAVSHYTLISLLEEYRVCKRARVIRLGQSSWHQIWEEC